MTENTSTMQELIDDLKITMKVESVDRNPNHINADNDKWEATADHWKCKLQRKDGGSRRSLTIYFSMGSGHHGAEPELDDVLDTLASDASGIENARSFEDWASEYGYDTDSRKAERTYRICQREAAKLRRFMGDHYDRLLWNTERL